jgi:hypothetical protein
VSTFWEFVKESLEDFTLRILIGAGVLSIVLDELANADERNIIWIEGASILLAVVIIVLVSSFINLKKQTEFNKLNERAEADRVITIYRNGIEIENF